MPEEMMDDLEFSEKIKGLENRELMEFMAWRLRDVSRRVSCLEGRNKVAGGIGGAVGAVIGGAISAILWFTTRNQS